MNRNLIAYVRKNTRTTQNWCTETEKKNNQTKCEQYSKRIEMPAQIVAITLATMKSK